VLIISSVFLFVGSIGIGVFSHFCEEEGLYISYYVPDEKVCAAHEVDHNNEPQSCSAEMEGCCCEEETSGNDGCCSLSSELVKVKLDFLNKLEVKAILIPVLQIDPVWEFESEIIDEEIITASGNDPPPLPIKLVLSYHQQWLI